MRRSIHIADAADYPGRGSTASRLAECAAALQSGIELRTFPLDDDNRRRVMRNLSMVAAQSREGSRVARAGIEDRAFRYSLKRVSPTAWRPPAQQHQNGADANPAGPPARGTPATAEAAP